jgi:transposase InsO family protein
LADDSKSLFANGVHTFADCQIGEVLTYLQEIGTAKFPRIMILAGKMADRGITFGSANYADCMARHCVPWHLTEMYYLAAKSTDQPNLLQACRLCGIYVDNIPLTFYSNAVDDIVKAYHVQEELIERARAAEISATNERNLACRSMKDIIPTIPIAREKCPKRRFVGQKVPCRVKRVKDDSKEGGWDWRAEGRMPEKLPAEFGTGGRPVQYKEDKTEEEIREIRERVDVHDDLSDADFRDVCDKFAKWSQGHTKIARFMQSGVDPRKRYTRQEFAEICREYSIEQSHLFRRTYGNSQGYGKIFKREGNSVFMFPQLVPAFTQNF